MSEAEPVRGFAHERFPQKDDRSYVRLLELLPEQDDSIRVKLHTFLLAEAPTFHALEYVWDKDFSDRFIECNGGRFKVTRSLHDFLRQLRYIDTPYLWVDAISVDQRNESELLRAVRNMPEVCAAASRTLCWAGTDYHSSVKILINAVTRVDTLVEAADIFLSATDIYHSGSLIKHEYLAEFAAVKAGINNSVWDEVDMFLNHKVFQRLWVARDIVCSKDPVIFSNGEVIQWSQFIQTIIACLLFSSRPVLQSTSAIAVVTVETLHRKYQESSEVRLNLPEILLAFDRCGLKSTSANDHVYAAYSVAKILHHGRGLRGVNDDVGLMAAVKVNEVARQPLNLSLDRTRFRIPVWGISPSNRFLFNHSASTFSASFRNEFGDRRIGTEDSEETQRTVCSGFAIDVIRDTSEYLPSRRHCDHYAASGGNSFFLSEWLSFARETAHATQKEDDILLAFADTVQARGSAHIWESPDITTSERLQNIQDFAAFLENPDGEETEAIRMFFAACFPSHDRRFAITKSRRFCLVPETTQRGDPVVLLNGSRVPHILVPTSDLADCNFRGEAYIHGMMHGEMEGHENLEEAEFRIM